MKKIVSLKRLKEAVFYDPQTGAWVWLRPNPMALKVKIGDKVIETKDSQGHLQFSIDGKIYLAHRLAWYYMTGKWPTHDLDHKDRNRQNNKWKNLRKSNHQLNAFNSKVRKTNRTGLKGVTFAKGPGTKKYMARIKISNKSYFLGRFKTAQEASAAYLAAAKEFHGEFFYGGHNDRRH